MYASSAVGGYRGGNIAQTATFDTSSKNGRYNEDALPAMPSWDNATSRREEVMEMEKMDHQNGRTNGAGDGMLYQNPEPNHAYGYQQGQQESLLPKQETGRYYGAGQRSPSARQDFAQEGDMGGMTAQPYSDNHNQRQQQFSPGPYGSQNRASPSPYSPTVHTPVSPVPHYNAGTNTDYYGAGADYPQQRGGYDPSVPPSYHTGPPSDVVSPLSPTAQASYPGQASYQPYGGGNSGLGRKPVQGTWREV